MIYRMVANVVGSLQNNHLHPDFKKQPKVAEVRTRFFLL